MNEAMGASAPEPVRYQTMRAETVLASEQSVLRLIARNTPLPELLAEVCRRAESLLGEGAACTIMVVDDDGVHLRIGAAPSLPESYSSAIDGTVVGPQAGSCGTAVYTRRMIVVDDIEADPLWDDFRDLAMAIGMRACWSIPFDADGHEVIGAFAVYHRDVRRPTIEEEALLRDISHSVGLAVHQDRIARLLAQSEERHRVVLEHLHEGIVVQSRDGIVLACNSSARRLLHVEGDMVGRQIGTVMTRSYHDNGELVADHERPTHRALRTGEPLLGLTLGVELVDGDVIWITENVVPILMPGETEASSVLVSFNDIGPMREAHQQLRFLATRDSLTGLYNRVFLADRMDAMLSERDPRGAQANVAVLFVDLDGFKKVNDTAGHEAGDALLRSVARRLLQCVRETDTLARVGGDEFVIAVNGFGDAGSLAALARHVLDAIAVPFAVAGNEYYLGVSIGISMSPNDGTEASELIRNADAAMYHAKQSGRNNFQFFTVELNEQLQRRFMIEQGLRKALSAGELSLVYQPVVDSRHSQIVGAEALLRWHSEELGHMSPSEFIPVAEDTGIIVAIGDWVLEQACMRAARWRRTIAPNLVIAVNLSPRQFNDGLVERVAQCLQRSGLDPRALELEITERLLMGDSETLLPMLNALAAMGVRISVDDFGTGYSSLSYLKRFPLHNLKVDRSFVAGLPDHHDSVAITQAVVAMAHSLGMHVTAEGVETAAQAEFLRSIGCDTLQGYFFSVPVGALAYEETLARVADF
ncbi:EAL domain-containing protein [Pararobbsia silviterrae]|uniref:EAL domain-containing protein n=2 Tax=Pararobbsia silviterrae TaxID=1792498 RepID=A0A494XZS5_9BURK|nr:EAL domain-containing protein [Pararobbsia silviterrae]